MDENVFERIAKIKKDFDLKLESDPKFYSFFIKMERILRPHRNLTSLAKINIINESYLLFLQQERKIYKKETLKNIMNDRKCSFKEALRIHKEKLTKMKESRNTKVILSKEGSLLKKRTT